MAKAILNPISGLGLVRADNGTIHLLDSDAGTVEFIQGETDVLARILPVDKSIVCVFEEMEDVGEYPFDAAMRQLRMRCATVMCLDAIIRLSRAGDSSEDDRRLTVRVASELLEDPDTRRAATRFFNTAPLSSARHFRPGDGEVVRFLQRIDAFRR